MMFWPSFILWSIENTKDPLTVLSLLIVIWSALKIYYRFRLKYVFLLGAGLWVFSLYRWYLFVPLSMWLGIALLVKIIRGLAKTPGKIVLFIALITLLSLSFNSRNPLFLKVGGKVKSVINEAISVNIGNYLTGGSVYKTYPEGLYTKQAFRKGGFLDKIDAGSLLYAMVKGLIYFLLLPFPWAMHSKLQVISFPEILLWYALLPFCILGLLMGLRYKLRETFLIGLITAIFTLIYALTEANVGTAFRHRSFVLPFYLIFAAIAIERTFMKSQLVIRGKRLEAHAI
jgi:hypothetical protein